MAYRAAPALGASRRTAARLKLVDPHRPGDVLQLLLARVLEVCVELAAHLPVGVVGDADAAGLGDAFEPRGNIDAVAEDVAVLDDDVADMDADAEFDAPSCGTAALRSTMPC